MFQNYEFPHSGPNKYEKLPNINPGIHQKKRNAFQNGPKKYISKNVRMSVEKGPNNEPNFGPKELENKTNKAL